MKTSIDYRKKVAIETTPQNEKEALSLAEECWALGCDERAEQLLQQVNDKSLAGDVLFLRAMMLSTRGGSATEVQKLLTQAEAQGNPVAKLYNCLKAKDVKTDQLSAMAKDMPDWYLAQYCSWFAPVEEYLGPAPTAQEADEMLQQAERDAAAAIKARKDKAEAAQKAERKAAAKQKAKEEADRRKLLALRSADAQQIQNLKIYLILLAGLFAIVELFLVLLTNVSFIAAVALSCYCSYRAIRSLVQKIPWDGIATPVRRFSLKFHIYVSVAVVTLCSHILAYVFDKMLLFASLYVLAIWITKKYIAAGMDKKAAQYREENFRKYKMMAELGGEKEQAKLAILYDDGYCVPKNRDEARKWYSKAKEGILKLAEQGDAEAQWQVGCYDWNGERKIAAGSWWRKAAEQGYAPAQCDLHVLVRENDQDEARKWIRKAAEQRYARAQAVMGYLHIKGELGFPVSVAAAVEWYRKAAEQGYGMAQSGLGNMYEKGVGVPQNNAEAVKWYRKAAEQGYEYAIDALDRLGK